MMLPLAVKDVLDDFVQTQLNVMGDSIEKIILYGSYARGDYNEDSDVDVMVLTNISDKEALSKQLYRMFDSVYDYQLDRDIEVNPNMQNIEFYKKWLGRYPYYANIEKEGVTLYERVRQ